MFASWKRPVLTAGRSAVRNAFLLIAVCASLAPLTAFGRDVYDEEEAYVACKRLIQQAENAYDIAYEYGYPNTQHWAERLEDHCETLRLELKDMINGHGDEADTWAAYRKVTKDYRKLRTYAQHIPNSQRRHQIMRGTRKAHNRLCEAFYGPTGIDDPSDPDSIRVPYNANMDEPEDDDNGTAADGSGGGSAGGP